MFDFNDPSLTVQMCKFQALIQKSHIVIKFPCSYFVEWKTINNRYSICTQKRVRTANDQAIFNQKLTFYTQMVYNIKKKQYYSKQTFLVLNLVSKSRPDQVKLVGRVSVDLADVLNRSRYSEMTQMKLNYCSVEGSIMLSIHLLNKRDSNLSVRDLDRSAFTDYFSLNTNQPPPVNTITISKNISKTYITNNDDTGSPRVPTFAQVNNHHKYSEQQRFIRINQQHHNDQELMSFQNSYEKPQYHQNQKHTIRTQSREQSLIQRLEERNLGSPWSNHERQRENGNMVDVKRKQIKTGRDYNDLQQQVVVSKRTHGRSKSRTLAANNGNNDEIVQITHRINTTNKQSQFYKTPYQSDTPVIKNQQKPLPPPLQKPTSPPSYQWSNNNNKSLQQQQQSSEQYQYRTQKFLSIVQKLQRQKQQQQGMIKQLKAMVVGKSMRKLKTEQKDKTSIVVQTRKLQEQLVQLQQQYKQLQQSQQQNTLKLNKLYEQNSNLKEQLIKLKSNELEKDNQLGQNERTITELRKKLLLMDRKYEEDMRIKDKGYERVQRQCKRLQQQCRRLQQQCRRLQQQCKPMSQSMSQPMPSWPSNTNNQPHVITSKHQQQLQQQQQIKITITKDENIYEQMQRENIQLSQRVKQLQKQNAVYQQLLKQKIDNSSRYSNGDENKVLTQQQHQQINNNDTSSLLQTMLTNLHQQQPQTHTDALNDQFKITITRDQNVYDQQEKQNTELYKRVIELEDQVEKYRQLINDQNNSQPIIYASNNQQQQQPSHFTEQQIRKQQRRLTSKSSLQREDKYQQQGFTIRLTKDNNIFENQQKQLQQLYKQIDELQGKLKQKQQQISKYISTYGNINDQHEYKISITRQQNIYDDQEKQIKQLWKTVDNKDQQIIQLTQRISLLQHQLHEICNNNNSNNDDGQIMIRINRDENIYQQQECQLSELSKKVILLEESIQAKEKDVQQKEKVIVEKEEQIKKLQQELLLVNTKLEECMKEIKSLSQIVSISNNNNNRNTTNFNNNRNNHLFGPQNCPTCLQLQSKLHQLQQTNILIQQQRFMMEQQIAKLQQQKFCYNSTQNELKIQIEELNQEVYQLGLENQKLNEELMIVQQENQELRNQEEVIGEYEIEQCEYVESQVQVSVDRNNHHVHCGQQQYSNNNINNNTNFNNNTPNSTTLIQQQNTHLRQSLTLFQQQLQQQQLTIGQLQQRISRLMHEKQILIEQNDQITNQLTKVKQKLQIVKSEHLKQLNERQTVYKERLEQVGKSNTRHQQKQQQQKSRFTQQLLQQKDKLLSSSSPSPSTHNIQSIISNSRIQQSLLVKKQQQIQHLQAELNLLNESLNELSLSYHSMQQTFQNLQKQKQIHMKQLNEQKQQEVEHIRKEHQQINAMLKNQLQQIQQLIAEKERHCVINQEKLQMKASLIEQLSSQLDQLTNQLNILQVQNHKVVGENEGLKINVNRMVEQVRMLQKDVNALNKEVDNLTIQNEKLSGENHQLQQAIQQLQLENQQYTNKPLPNNDKLIQLKQAINTIHSNRQLRLQQFKNLQQILQLSNNQTQNYLSQSSETLNQPLSRLITRQLQKIKTNILRNHTSQNYTIHQRSSLTTQRNAINIDRKAFTQKAALLKYLKPLEDILKNY